MTTRASTLGSSATLATVLTAQACAPAASLTEVAPPTAQRSGRDVVRVSDGKFVVGGRPHHVVGTNLWAAMNLGSKGARGDRERLRRELDRLVDLGINNVRIMAASEGPDGAPYRIAPALMKAPGEYDKEVFEGLDAVLAECAERNLRAVMVLTNFWEWSGGMAQYVSWAEDTKIPYPSENVWTDFTAYASRFYTCDRCQAWYRAHIRTIVGRTNSITGVAYRDDPSIFAWELANEPRLYPAAWIDDTAAFIRSLGTAQMVTTGSEGRIGGPFVPTHDGPDIDYTTAHLWPQNWQWYDPQQPETLATALDTSSAYIREHTELSGRLGKPLVLEEFGLARDATSGRDPYDPTSPVTQRDRLYATVFRAIERSVANGEALQGQAFWAWAGEARPPQPWLGDPPHEKPGWYSVYDTDASTLALVNAHARALAGARVRP